jgi:hypothetical protein
MGNRLFIAGDLSLNGRLSILNDVSMSRNLAVGLQVNATSFNATSDYRIKSNIISLDNTFIVDNLRPVYYFNNILNKNDIGLIAHELQDFYPCLVNGVKDGESIQNINYNGVIGILINEIKNMKIEINNLKSEIEIIKLNNIT